LLATGVRTLFLSAFVVACSAGANTVEGDAGPDDAAGASSGNSGAAGMAGAGAISGTGGTFAGGGGMSGAGGGGAGGGGAGGSGGNSGTAGAMATCPSAVPADELSADRQRCSFAAGDHAAKSLGLSSAARANIPLRHVIVVMKENRSFDHLFGDLKKLQPAAEVADASFVNKDLQGVSVPRFHEPTTCVSFDPDHQWGSMHDQVNSGAMDGFVTSAAKSTGTDGHFVMGYYDQNDLPFYYYLASNFALADHFFASARTGTFPNRDYLLLATSDKVYSTQYSTWPDPSLPTIIDELTQAGVDWGVYADDHPLEETLNDPKHSWEQNHPWSPVADLIDAFKNDQVPSVAFVDGRINLDDEHPMADIQRGEAWTKKLFDAALASKAWSSTAMLLVYDEAGGFADHVPPNNAACLPRPQDADFHELGARVPFIAISPWARRHYVSHTEKQHTSITRFIEALFDLPALTARDANSDGLLDLFDFACPPLPIPTAPAAGTQGCIPGGKLWLDKSTFAPGEDIVVHFSGGPGNPADWLGAYPLHDSIQMGSSFWGYVGGADHTATVGNTSGTITLHAASAGTTPWPLPAGSSWMLYFLVNDGYDPIASIRVDISG